MEPKIKVDATIKRVRPVQAGEVFDEDKGALFKIGFLLKDVLKVLGADGNADELEMTQCCCEQHFISIYASEIYDINCFKQVVYQALRDDMNMDAQLAKRSRTYIATCIIEKIASSNEINQLTYCTVQMEVIITFLLKKRDSSDSPSGDHGYSELRRRIESEQCSICQEDCSNKKNIIVTTCHHVYDRECILDWLHRGHFTCPLCRSDLGPIVGRPMTFP